MGGYPVHPNPEKITGCKNKNKTRFSKQTRGFFKQVHKYGFGQGLRETKPGALLSNLRYVCFGAKPRVFPVAPVCKGCGRFGCTTRGFWLLKTKGTRSNCPNAWIIFLGLSAEIIQTLKTKSTLFVFPFCNPQTGYGTQHTILADPFTVKVGPPFQNQKGNWLVTYYSGTGNLPGPSTSTCQNFHLLEPPETNKQNSSSHRCPLKPTGENKYVFSPQQLKALGSKPR